MQIKTGKIFNNYNKIIGKIITRRNKKRCNENVFKTRIIEKLKEAEKEIDEGKVISAKVVLNELSDIYG